MAASASSLVRYSMRAYPYMTSIPFCACNRALCRCDKVLQYFNPSYGVSERTSAHLDIPSLPVQVHPRIANFSKLTESFLKIFCCCFFMQVGAKNYPAIHSCTKPTFASTRQAEDMTASHVTTVSYTHLTLPTKA